MNLLPPLGLIQAEIRELRASTPAAGAFVHLNHASTSLLDKSTIESQSAYFDLEAHVGSHRALESVADKLNVLPAAIASLVGAQTHQIAITESASRGWAMALSAVAPDCRLQAFVCSHEWGGNVTNLLSQRRISITKMEGAPSDDWHTVVLDALERRDKGAVPIVSLPIIASATGTIFKLEGVARAVRDAGGWFFVDASQAVGQLPVDVGEIGADALVFPARKWLRGPRGIGVLCLSDRALSQFGTPFLTDLYGTQVCYSSVTNSSFLRTSEDAGRFQMYDYHPALRLGLLAAIQKAQTIGVSRIHIYTRELCERLFNIIGNRWPLVEVERPASGLLCVSMQTIDAAKLATCMWQHGFNIAHVPARYAPLAFGNGLHRTGLLRLSPHAMTLPLEIDKFASAFVTEVENYVF